MLCRRSFERTLEIPEVSYVTVLLGFLGALWYGGVLGCGMAVSQVSHYLDAADTQFVRYVRGV